MTDFAQIITFNDFQSIRASLGKIVCTSGGFDPIHPGHTSCIIESKHYGDTLVVIVNGDSFLKQKKGHAFMDLATRCQIVASIRHVDYVIPFEIENDSTVCEALRQIKPHVFTKGGDRTDYSSIPEWSVCQQLGIQIVPQVGFTKAWNSSEFLRAWGKFYRTSQSQD